MSNAEKPREWALHGFTKIHREMEIGEVTHCTYEERVVGPKVGDAIVDVIEKSAYDALMETLYPVHIGVAKIVSNDLLDSLVKRADKAEKLLHSHESSNISSLVAQNFEMEEVHKFHVIEIKDLREQLSTEKAYVQKTEENLITSQLQLAKTSAERDEARAKLLSMTASRNIWAKDADSLAAQLAETRDSLAHYKNELSLALVASDKYKAQLAEAKAQTTKMREACANYPAMVDAALAKAERLERALAYAKKRLGEVDIWIIEPGPEIERLERGE